MARELRDVLHYFLDTPVEAKPPPASPALAVPTPERDPVRRGFVWNLAVELARAGEAATVVAPRPEEADSPWPDPGPGPLGARFLPSRAGDLRALSTEVEEAASDGSAAGSGKGFWLVQVPEPWLEEASDSDSVLKRVLFFVTPDSKDLERVYARIADLHAAAPGARIGVTMHAVRSIDEARTSFLELAGLCERELGRPLTSYGLLVDDLDVYRGIVERRVVGLCRPHSRASRALRDVARLLREDASQAHA